MKTFYYSLIGMYLIYVAYLQFGIGGYILIGALSPIIPLTLNFFKEEVK